MAQWAAETNERTPLGTDTVLDYVDTPTFDNPQPFTISFARDPLPPTTELAEGNSALRGQITYRVGGVSRTVICDWRGQATVIAQQVSVRARSFPPVPAPYTRSADPRRHSVTVGLGAVAKSNILLTNDPTIVHDNSLPVPIQVPAMAIRVLLRAMLVEAIGPNFLWTQVLEDLIGTRLQYVGPGGIVHDEPVTSSHFQAGVDLGNADTLLFPALPAIPSGKSLAITPVWELSL